jgi:hypothetical protein
MVPTGEALRFDGASNCSRFSRRCQCTRVALFALPAFPQV